MEKVKKYTFMAILGALLLTFLLSAWISFTIIRPLNFAAEAARKISAGNLDAEIPAGGMDETGALLKTMTAMQQNIRDRMGREQNLKTLAQDRLADSIENSADSILLTDSTGVIIVANPQVKIMFPEFKNCLLYTSPSPRD